jgi:chromosome segregation ATPase
LHQQQEVVLPTGIQDIDELVHAFVDGEDANFKLFNYVNEVNSEVEKLEDTIGSVRKEIEAYTAKAAAAEAQVTAATSSVLTKLTHNEGKAAAYKRRLQVGMAVDTISRER